MTITEENGYPPLLFAAVKSGNKLAVRLLLENGAAPNAKFHGRYAMYSDYMTCCLRLVVPRAYRYTDNSEVHAANNNHS